ncbi:MAG TPA: hypothetical protein VJA21_08035 [Verrucomicrobiae bacterium]
MSEQPPPKRQHSCLFFGCIAGAVCLVALLLVFLLGLHLFKKAVNQYTDTAPMKMPALQLSQPEIEAVQHRFNNFSDATGKGQPTSPLELSGDEINALIDSNPDLRGAKDKLYVTIKDGRLHAQVSLPMDQIGLSMFKGRYLNGNGSFALSLQNGNLNLSPVDIAVKGKPVPGVYLDKLRQENLAAGLNSNPRVSGILNRLQSIEVKDGKLVLVPKKGT